MALVYGGKIEVWEKRGGNGFISKAVHWEPHVLGKCTLILMLLKLCVAPLLIYMSVCVHFPCTVVFQAWALGYSFLREGDIHQGTIWGLSLPLYPAFPQFWCWVSSPSLISLSSPKARECSPAAKGWPARETHRNASTVITLLNRALPGMAKSLADINQKRTHWSQCIDLYQQRVMVFRPGETNLTRKPLMRCLWIAMLAGNGCSRWIHPGWLHSEHCLDWCMTASASPQKYLCSYSAYAYYCSHLKQSFP